MKLNIKTKRPGTPPRNKKHWYKHGIITKTVKTRKPTQKKRIENKPLLQAPP
jgi:hypothetical protein